MNLPSLSRIVSDLIFGEVRPSVRPSVRRRPSVDGIGNLGLALPIGAVGSRRFVTHPAQGD